MLQSVPHLYQQRHIRKISGAHSFLYGNDILGDPLFHQLLENVESNTSLMKKSCGIHSSN